MNFKLNHIGYAVEDLPKAIDDFLVLGFNLVESTVDIDRKIEIAFIKKGNLCIELVCPSEEDSPIKKILVRNGPTPYHLCYSVDNINDAVAFLSKKKWLLIIKPLPAIAFNNSKVAFLYSKQLGIVELVEK